MKKKEYKRKLKRLERLMDRADKLDTKIYEDEIETLADEIEEYENKEFPIPRPSAIGLIEFHIERLDIEKKQMAKHLGVTPSHLTNLLKGDRRITEKFSNFIYDFDFYSLNKLK